MSPLLILMMLAVYALAGYLFWRERTLCYLLILVAGHLAMLLTPIWQRVYQATPIATTGFTLVGEYQVPWVLFLAGGPLLTLPALAFYYGLRHRLVPRHYAVIWLGYIIFVIYFLLIEAILDRAGTPLFAETLLMRDTLLPADVLQAALLAGVSLGILYMMVSTRHYALQMSAGPMLLSGIIASLLFLGIFASPLWVAGLLEQNGIIMTVATLVSFGLILWGVHLLASGLHVSRQQELVWH